MKLTGHLLAENENKANRTHFQKHFIHPTDPKQQRYLQQKKIVHAFTDNGWEDVETELPSFVFPEGTVINAEATSHYIMDLPAWGTAVVSPDGKQVNVYDRKNVSIYLYNYPTVTPNGVFPYEVLDENGVLVQDQATLKTHGILPEYTVARKATTQDATFEVINNKLYFVLPAGLTYPVQVWDDTDTSSVSNHDTRIINQGGSRDTNFDNSALQIDVINGVPETVRSIMEWTLSSGTGTITDVQVDFNVTTHIGGGGKVVELHELTSTFNEAQATWNDRLTSTPWTSAGGDFSATVVDSDAWAGTGNKIIYLAGSNATNPITLNFGDTVDFILKWNNENWGGSRDLVLMDDDSGTTPPVMTITFTAAVPASFTPQAIIY